MEVRTQEFIGDRLFDWEPKTDTPLSKSISLSRNKLAFASSLRAERKTALNVCFSVRLSFFDKLRPIYLFISVIFIQQIQA